MSNTGQPVKIIVQADTSQAAAQLQQLGAQASNDLQQVAVAATHATAATNQNRMAFMELGHSARSMADGLAAGMNPLRLLMMEAPRLTQAYAEAGAELQKKVIGMVPIIGGIAAAIGVAVLAWHEYATAGDDVIKKTEDMVNALNKVPAILEQINTLQKAGLLSPEAAQQYADYLNPHSGKKLYVGEDGNLTENPTSQRELPTFNYSMGYPIPTGNTIQNIPNKEATQDQINAWIKSKLPPAAPNQEKAAADLKDKLEKSRIEALSPKDREKEEIKEKYKKEIKELNDSLQKAGELAGPNTQEMVAKRIQEIRQREQFDIQGVDIREQQRRLREQFESAGQAGTQGHERAAKDLQAIEDQITAMETQQGALRGANYQKEYQLRVDAAQRAYFSGEINEQDYTHQVQSAANKRAEAQKTYNEQLKATQSLQQEIVRDQIEARLRGVEMNPFLTGAQKQDQSVPLMRDLMNQNSFRITQLQQDAQNPQLKLDAEKQITELMQQQAQLADKVAVSERPWAAQIAELVGRSQVNMVTLAQQFGTLFNGAVNSISRGIDQLIMGTKSWGQALREIYTAIAGEIINAIVSMGVRWVMTQIMMAVAGRSILASATAAIAPMAAMQSALWSTPATLATIASYGSAALAAPGFIASANAATLGLMGFAQGGYTGDGGRYDVAGVVHRGEFVFSAPAVQQIGRPVLEAMHNTGSGLAAGGGSNAAASPQHKTEISNFFDPNMLIEHNRRSAAHEKMIVDIMKNNIHKFR